VTNTEIVNAPEIDEDRGAQMIVGEVDIKASRFTTPSGTKEISVIFGSHD